MMRSCAQKSSRCTRTYDYRSVRLDRARRAAHASCRASVTPPASTTPTAATCIPTSTRSGWAAAAARAGVRIFENSWVTKLELAATADADTLAHTASGTVRARHLLIAGNALLGRLVPALARKLMAVGTYIAATEVLGEERARALITNNCGGRRHQLGARLFSPFRRPPPAVRRPRELLGHRSVRFRARSARAHRARVPATEPAHRIRLGRLRRHHAEPRAAFRTPRAECRISCRASPATAWCCPASRENSWPKPWRRSAERFDVFAKIPHRRLSGRHLLPPARAGARDAVVPAQGSALTTAAFNFELWLSALPVLLIAATFTWLLSLPLRNVVHRRFAVEPHAVRGRGHLRAGRRSSRTAARVRVVAAGDLGRAPVDLSSPRAAWARAKIRATRPSARATNPTSRSKSLYLVFWLQAVLAWIISLPLLGAFASNAPLGILDYLGSLLWLVGFVFEAGGDWQLARFKTQPGQCRRRHGPRLLALHSATLTTSASSASGGGSGSWPLRPAPGGRRWARRC